MIQKLDSRQDAAGVAEAQAGQTPGQVSIAAWRYDDGTWSKIPVLAAEEFPLQIFVNGSELVTTLCTPVKANCLVAGFLYNEGIISSIKDVASMRVCLEDFVADVRLTRTDFAPPTRRMLTSGCGGGASFIEEKSNLSPVNSEMKFTAANILPLMKQLYQQSEIHRRGGGVHASALADNDNIIVLAEDIGRHNTLDKIAGECLLMRIPFKDRMLITTGRISSEMLLKAARMEVPVVVSRSAPLTRSVALGEKLGITVIGYARGDHLEVYSHPERIGGLSN
ncbi:MAG: formate dehydrogenase accessory sulfurtransferase FdhD [Chloroflexi bacterium]|nr:formate dehydrogenase accessory sulfurtransferase FdhD [Chloroflexota bacterium]